MDELERLVHENRSLVAEIGGLLEQIAERLRRHDLPTEIGQLSAEGTAQPPINREGDGVPFQKGP